MGAPLIDTPAFFDTLFLNATSGKLLLWTLRKKLSAHVPVRDSANAASLAVAEAERTDVYVGLGLRHPSITDPGVRGGSDDVIGIGAVWLEVDVAAPGHRRKDLPATHAEVRRILAVGLAPSIAVWSGGGWHLYWLLRALWYFDGPDDRSRAAELLRRHQRLYIANAEALGWHVDATHDLARVLRVPGTVNRKEGMVRPVTVKAWHPERRYSIEELEAVLPVEVVPSRSVRKEPDQRRNSPFDSGARTIGGNFHRFPVTSSEAADDDEKEYSAKEIIDVFNDAHDVEQILRAKGYVKERDYSKGKVASLWLAPTSQTKMAGVKVFADTQRVWSWHGSDPLQGEHSHDAFSLITVLDYGGDVGKAVKATAEALGMVKKKSVITQPSTKNATSARRRLTRLDFALAPPAGNGE